MRRGAWLLLIAAIVVIGLVTILVKRATPPSSELRIGLILPLSGNAAVYGKSLQTGTDLAAREINAAGGVSGRQLRLVYEDTQADPKTAVSALRKLLTVDRPALVVGDMFSHTTLAVAPIAQEEGVVLISPTASAQAIPKVGDHIFTIYPSDAYDGQFLAERVPSLWPGATNIAVVYAQAEAMITCKDAFIASLQHPISVTAQEAIPSETRDLSPIVLNIRRAAPDVVFIAAFLPETALFLRQANEQGLATQFLGISTCYDPQLFEVAGPAADGLVLSAPFFDPDQQDPNVRSFVTEYTELYGKGPDVWAAYGYDVLRIAAEALSSEVAPLNKAVSSLAPFEGVTGRTSFNADGSVTKALRLLRANAESASFEVTAVKDR